MTRYQRARRIAFWRGFAVALIGITGWIYASGFAGSITP